MTKKGSQISFFFTAALLAVSMVVSGPARGNDERPYLKPFEIQASIRAEFSDADRFVPLSELPVVEYDEAEELQKERLSFDLTSVAISPDGEVSEAKVTTEDLALFEKALEAIAESQEGTDDELGFGGEAIDESVINHPDQRVRVYGTTGFPYRTIGRIDIGCTGTLIGPRHVLTAGHCVYNISTDKWYSALSFSPGQNGSSRPYGKIGWSKAISVTGWTRSHSQSYDYAMIVLSSRIGNTTGWMGYGYQNGNWTKYVNIAGYPADKSSGTMWREYGPMSTQLSNSRRVTHWLDTYGGMSGSGLYEYIASSGSRTIYAVHAYGGTSSNSGTRIDSTVFTNLRNWKTQNP